MPTRQAFELKSLAEATTTSTTYQTKDTLTFTPDANSDYWVISSGAFTSPSGEAFVTVLHGATVLLEQSVQAKEPTTPYDYLPYFGIAKITFGASPGSQSIYVKYKNDTSGQTTRIKDCRVYVIKADASDKYATVDAESSTSSTTYQDMTTLTFTPGTTGDYLVIGFAEMTMDAANAAGRGQLNYVTGSATYGDSVWYNKLAYYWMPFASMAKINLSNASKTFKLQFKSNAGTIIYYRLARILALRLDAFDNNYFTSNYGVQATTAATYQDMLTLTQTPQAVDHLILAVGAWNPSSTSVSGYAQVLQGASVLTELVAEGVNAAGYHLIGMVDKETLANTSTTWKWQTKAETAGTTVNADELAIAILQLGATPAVGGGTRRRMMSIS